MEEKFDSLMNEVRDSDSNVVLKKVNNSHFFVHITIVTPQIPEVPNEMRDQFEPTGMAAALEVALRQRRQHFSDHDKRKLPFLCHVICSLMSCDTAGRSRDDSFSSEWQSP